MKVERFELRLGSDMLSRIESWRAQQSEIPSRSAAARRLIELGLESQNSLTFYLMRFQLLSYSLTPEGLESISDSCVFAWLNSVFPFHDITQEGFAKPFASSFEISSEMIEELATTLDSIWIKIDTTVDSSPLTFYELEERFVIRTNAEKGWNRAKLIVACRYFYLRKMFDESFWESLLAPMRYPTEARIIVANFDRRSDVYFG